MVLNDLIFADGVINHYEFRASSIKMSFTDYDDNKFLLNFYGVTSIKEVGSVGIDLQSVRIKKDSSKFIFIASDDGGIVLEIVYDTESIDES